MNFDSFIGKKVLVKETKVKITLLGIEEEVSEYNISDDDTTIADIRKVAGKLPMRVWLPDTVGTMDVQGNRLNVRVEKQDDASYEVTRIYFG